MTEAVARWLAMGGYAAFVWPAYTVACVVLGGLVWQSWWRHRSSLASLERLQRQSGFPRQ